MGNSTSTSTDTEIHRTFSEAFLLLSQVGMLFTIAQRMATLQRWMETPYATRAPRRRKGSRTTQRPKGRMRPMDHMPPLDQRSVYRCYAAVVRRRYSVGKALFPLLGEIQRRLPLGRVERGWPEHAQSRWQSVVEPTVIEVVTQVSERCLHTVPIEYLELVDVMSEPPANIEELLVEALSPYWTRLIVPCWLDAPPYDELALRAKLSSEYSHVMPSRTDDRGVPLDLMSQEAAADFQGVTSRTIRDWIKKKKLKGWGLSNHVGKADLLLNGTRERRVSSLRGLTRGATRYKR